MGQNIFGIKKFELSEYAISGNALLGIRDSGKTWAGCEAAEELFDAGVPSICFDPIGKWHSLRVPGKGKGYPFVVAGGRFGDLPLTRKNAADLVRGAMQDGISLVLDLFSREMSKADWRYIVQQSMEILLYENEDHGMRHVFLEEAGEFVPQIVQDGATFNAVEKVVRMGGNSKLGVTLIHQRPADINKSVLELCANVILLKQSGKNTVTDLKKWAQLIAPDQAAAIGSTLPHLKPGHGWAFIAGIPAPFQFAVPARNSKHPDRREAVKGGATRAALPAPKFVEAMKAKLAAADAPKATAAKLQPPALIPAPKLDGRAFQKQLAEVAAVSRRQGFQEGLAAAGKAAEAFHAALSADLDGLARRFTAELARTYSTRADRLLQEINKSRPAKLPSEGQGSPVAAVPVPRSMGSAPKPQRAPNPAPAATDSGSNLPKGELVVLTAIAQRDGQGITREHIAVLTGYKSTSRKVYLRALEAKGLIQKEGSRIFVTDAGREAMPDGWEPLPTGADLRAHVLQTLPAGEKRILEVVLEFYDAEVTREELRERTGYKSTSVKVYVRQLAARELVVVTRSGIKASGNLF